MRQKNLKGGEKKDSANSADHYIHLEDGYNLLKWPIPHVHLQPEPESFLGGERGCVISNHILIFHGNDYSAFSWTLVWRQALGSYWPFFFSKCPLVECVILSLGCCSRTWPRLSHLYSLHSAFPICRISSEIFRMKTRTERCGGS